MQFIHLSSIFSRSEQFQQFKVSTVTENYWLIYAAANVKINLSCGVLFQSLDPKLALVIYFWTNRKCKDPLLNWFYYLKKIYYNSPSELTFWAPMDMVFQKLEKLGGGGGGGEMDILRSTNKLFKSKQTFYHMLWPSWFSETYKINWYFCNDCFSLMVGEPDIYLFTVW